MHHFENHGKPLLVGIYRAIILPNFLRWCMISSIHSMSQVSLIFSRRLDANGGVRFHPAPSPGFLPLEAALGAREGHAELAVTDPQIAMAVA